MHPHAGPDVEGLSGPRGELQSIRNAVHRSTVFEYCNRETEVD